MRYSYNWLKELVSLEDVPFSELLAGLSRIGLHSETIISESSDYIFELEIPANRGDLLSIWGLAREVSALFRLPGPTFPFHPGADGEPARAEQKVKITAPEACPFYSGSLVSGIGVGASPPQLAERLKAFGFRSVNNVVDITNYVLLELGQPLHAFDADKISGVVEVRFAKAGETLVTLDGEERKLDEKVLVIADAVKVLALAGIMGGKESEVTAGTGNVFLESAFFMPQVVRAGRKAVGLETESSMRFERGVDPALVVAALERVKTLFRKTAQGRPGHNVKAGRVPRKHLHIPFRPQQLKNLLGVEIPPEEVESVLQKIGCSVRSGDHFWQVAPPSFRRDLETEVDLVEEIARFHGYDRIPSSLPQVQLLPSRGGFSLSRIEEIKNFFVSAGFDEVITLGLTDGTAGASRVRIANPLSQEQRALREDILPGLIQTTLANLNRGNLSLQLFEFGRIYRLDGQGFVEENRLGLVMTDGREGLLKVKSLLVNLAKRFGLGRLDVVPARPQHAGLSEAFSLSLRSGGRFAVFGVVQTAKGDLLAAEIFIQDLLNLTPVPVRFNDWPKLPAVVRDYSFLVPESLSWAEIEKAVCRLSELISTVKFFDLYKSSELPEGFQSVAFSVHFQSVERTLTHSEIDSIQTRLIAELEKLGLKLRE